MLATSKNSHSEFRQQQHPANTTPPTPPRQHHYPANTTIPPTTPPRQHHHPAKSVGPPFSCPGGAQPPYSPPLLRPRTPPPSTKTLLFLAVWPCAAPAAARHCVAPGAAQGGGARRPLAREPGRPRKDGRAVCGAHAGGRVGVEERAAGVGGVGPEDGRRKLRAVEVWKVGGGKMGAKFVACVHEGRLSSGLQVWRGRRGRGLRLGVRWQAGRTAGAGHWQEEQAACGSWPTRHATAAMPVPPHMCAGGGQTGRPRIDERCGHVAAAAAVCGTRCSAIGTASACKGRLRRTCCRCRAGRQDSRCGASVGGGGRWRAQSVVRAEERSAECGESGEGVGGMHTHACMVGALMQPPHATKPLKP
eukprot:363211-Chlamydomonas_euryale.AAC.4